MQLSGLARPAKQAKARMLLHLPSKNLIKDGLLLKLSVSG